MPEGALPRERVLAQTVPDGSRLQPAPPAAEEAGSDGVHRPQCGSHEGTDAIEHLAPRSAGKRRPRTSQDPLSFARLWGGRHAKRLLRGERLRNGRARRFPEGRGRLGVHDLPGRELRR